MKRFIIRYEVDKKKCSFESYCGGVANAIGSLHDYLQNDLGLDYRSYIITKIANVYKESGDGMTGNTIESDYDLPLSFSNPNLKAARPVNQDDQSSLFPESELYGGRLKD